MRQQQRRLEHNCRNADVDNDKINNNNNNSNNSLRLEQNRINADDDNDDGNNDRLLENNGRNGDNDNNVSSNNNNGSNEGQLERPTRAATNAAIESGVRVCDEADRALADLYLQREQQEQV